MVLIMYLWWNWHTHWLEGPVFVGSNPTRYTMCEYCIIRNILDFQSNVGGSSPPIRSDENKDFINKWIG